MQRLNCYVRDSVYSRFYSLDRIIKGRIQKETPRDRKLLSKVR